MQRETRRRCSPGLGPVDGEPADAVERMMRYLPALRSADVPKLMFDARPSALISGAIRDECMTWQNQTVATLDGRHLTPEEQPVLMARELTAWLERLDESGGPADRRKLSASTSNP